MDDCQMNVDGLLVHVVRKRKLAYLHIRVKPPLGLVVVTAPYNYSQDTIASLVRKNWEFIEKTKEKVVAQYSHHHKDYVTGEIHHLWGVPYQLEVREVSEIPQQQHWSMLGNEVKENIGVTREGQVLHMIVKDHASREERRDVLFQFYREEMEAVLPALVAKWEEKTGLKAKEWRLKRMTTKWGTCNVRAKRIWLNVHLAKEREDCLTYIIIHELCHLYERYHNQVFYDKVASHCPEYKDIEKELGERRLSYE